MDSAPRAEVTAWPKVELHRHLEGSVRLETAWHWAQQSPTLDLGSRAELRSHIQFDGRRDFAHFLSKFGTLRQLYQEPRAIEQVTREAVADAAADQVRYLELRFSPDHFARQAEHDPEEIAALIVRAGSDEATRQNVLLRFLLTIGRGYDPATAERILAIALALQTEGVVGLDLAGDELEFPAPPFHSLIERAASAGLGITIHAGEVGSPRAVWQAIREFGAARIGHGIRSVDDPQPAGNPARARHRAGNLPDEQPPHRRGAHRRRASARRPRARGGAHRAFHRRPVHQRHHAERRVSLRPGRRPAIARRPCRADPQRRPPRLPPRRRQSRPARHPGSGIGWGGKVENGLTQRRRGAEGRTDDLTQRRRAAEGKRQKAHRPQGGKAKGKVYGNVFRL